MLPSACNLIIFCSVLALPSELLPKKAALSLLEKAVIVPGFRKSACYHPNEMLRVVQHLFFLLVFWHLILFLPAFLFQTQSSFRIKV